MSNETIQSLLQASSNIRGRKAPKGKFVGLKIQPHDLEEMKIFAEEHGSDLSTLLRAGAKLLMSQAR